jgi:hypothetical protein
MRAEELTGPSLAQRLEPLLSREIAGIAAIDAAIARETAPDYVVMYQDTKNGKQANVEQMATLVRMRGGMPPERGGVRKLLMKAQASMSARVSTTMTLHAMRVAEAELVTAYSDAIVPAEGLLKRALTKALGRALVHTHVLAAHLAHRTGSKTDARLLPYALTDYFVRPDARACMRCHLDRAGAAGALERTDPHPYTYICAGCHDEVLAELPADLADQMDRWPRAVREAKVMQHAISRVSKLNAIGRVLMPLSGLPPEMPTPAAANAVIVPAMTPVPGPAADERPGVLAIDPAGGVEAEYTEQLFNPPRIWRAW